MTEPALPPNEAERIAALHALRLVDTPPEERFERLTRLASRLFAAPIALVTLVDAERQWFKSRVGVQVSELPRRASVCGHVIAEGAMLVVPDATTDQRFAQNPLVIHEPRIRFYAGQPLRGPGGHLVGTLCVMDYQPRTFDEADRAALYDLALLAERELNQGEATSRLLFQIAQAIAAAPDAASALQSALKTVCTATGWSYGEVWMPSESDDTLRCGATWHEDSEALSTFRSRSVSIAFTRGAGLPGKVRETGRPEWIADVTSDPPSWFLRSEAAAAAGLGAALAVPIGAGSVQAVLVFFMRQARPRDAWLVEQAAAAAGQMGVLIQHLLERRRSEAVLDAERAELTRRVAERTADLSTANAKLAHTSRLKDEFLANMSHELRTPLNTILGLSEALDEEVFGPLSERQRKSVGGIAESGRHLLALINDILDLSKIEAQQITLVHEPLDVAELCEASMRLVSQAAHARRLVMTTTVDGAVTTLSADGRRLKQILVNLLSNAVKFTPEGGQVGLEVRGEASAERVHFTVWDTGIGIAPSDQGRLFQPFVQLDSSLARHYEGTGLGLALVARLAELHSGSVALESAPGAGSRFTVTLPWTPAGARKPQPRPLAAATVRRLLLVEDSPTVAEQIERYLRDMGIALTVHPRAEGVLEQIAAVEPDVVLLDILLPDRSGWDVLASIKRDSRAREIPVVVVSVVDEPERALALGAAASLVKPLSASALRATLAELEAPDPYRSGTGAGAAGDARLVLVAEDNPSNVATISDYLGAKGYRLAVAHDGRQAVERALELTPDIILMDIQMPVLDGLEAIRLIRGHAHTAAIPIIAVTALAMPGDRERCIAAGADDYLSKPLLMRELIRRVELLLAQPREG